MTGTDIRNAGGIYFEKIKEGFEDYQYKILKMNQAQAYFYLQGLGDQNGAEAAFMDFYYSRLDERSILRIHEVLSEEECRYLQKYKKETDSLFVPLDEKLMKIHLKLNEREMLFSTFYFTAAPCTVWGNYNQEYIIFKRKLSK